jgi:hypothetical protein
VHWASGIPYALFGRELAATPRALRAARTKLYAKLERSHAKPEHRHCERSEAIHTFLLSLRGKMDCFASLAMTISHPQTVPHLQTVRRCAFRNDGSIVAESRSRGVLGSGLHDGQFTELCTNVRVRRTDHQGGTA